MRSKIWWILFVLSLLVFLPSVRIAAQDDDLPDLCNSLLPRYEPHKHRLVLVDWATGADVRTLATDLDDTLILGWSMDCRYLAGAVGSTSSMATVVWDAEAGVEIGRVPDAHLQPHHITWGPGNFLVVETRNGAILWNVPANVQYPLTTTFNINTVRNFSRLCWDADNGQLLANLAVGGRVVYDLATGVELPAAENVPQMVGAVCGEDQPASPVTVTPVQPVAAEAADEALIVEEDYPSVIAWSPDDRWFAVVGDYGVLLYNATDLEQPPVVLPFDNPGGLEAMMFSPDNQWLAVGDIDGMVRIWSTATGELRYVLRAANAANGAAGTDSSMARVARYPQVAISEDSRWLAMRYQEIITRWDLAQGADQQPDSYPIPEEKFFSMIFDHDGRLLVAGSANTDSRATTSSATVQPSTSSPDAPVDYTIRVWDVVSGNLVGALTEVPSRPEHVIFLRGGEEAVAYAWDVDHTGFPVIWWRIATGTILGEMRVEWWLNAYVWSPTLDRPLTVNTYMRSYGGSVKVQPGENANEQVFTLDFDDGPRKWITQAHLIVMNVAAPTDLITFTTPPEREDWLFARALFNNARTTLTTIDAHGRIFFWSLGAPVEELAAQEPVVLSHPSAILDQFIMHFGVTASDMNRPQSDNCSCPLGSK